MVRLNQQPTPGTNRLGGHIAEAIYVGDHLRIRVSTEAGSDIWAHIPIDVAAAGLAEGDRCVISWAPDDGRLLAAEG